MCAEGSGVGWSADANATSDGAVTMRNLDEVLAAEAAARDAAWSRLRAEWGPDVPDSALVDLVLDDPSQHLWRTVDAALDRSVCPACGASLGSGPRGCGPCDYADGIRFAGQEPDRPGVPPGNEHAVRVSLTVVRFPHRWPEEAVIGNRIYLPLFAAGDMPTKTEKYALLAAIRAGRAAELTGATSFAEMAARIAAAPVGPQRRVSGREAPPSSTQG